jgi:hypothetical protein
MSVSLDQAVARQRTRDLTAPPGHVLRLTWCLAVAAATASALTAFLPDVLTGPAVTNANARGTALVMLILGVPALLISMTMARGGSWRAHLVWIGTVAYLAYNGLMLLFATPFNRLFLVYVVTYSLALFTLGFLVLGTRPSEIVVRLTRLPRRGMAVYAWTIVFLNVLVWLRAIVPALLDDDPGSVLAGTGVSTNPVWIQDLVFWLPMAAVAAWWLWRRQPWGYVLIGAWLVYGLMESIGVAVDQLIGHAADPASPQASVAGAVLFTILAVIGLIPLYYYFRPGVTPDQGQISSTPPVSIRS